MSTSATKPGIVTLSSLVSAIRDSVDSGRIGTPVNVRVHWQFSETDLAKAAFVAARIADEALALEEPAWRIRNGASAVTQRRILNLLAEDRRGRTLLATLCRGKVNEFSLTVFGNHGTLRLEHAGLDESSLDELPSSEATWQKSLDEAIR